MMIKLKVMMMNVMVLKVMINWGNDVDNEGNGVKSNDDKVQGTNDDDGNDVEGNDDKLR